MALSPPRLLALLVALSQIMRTSCLQGPHQTQRRLLKTPAPQWVAAPVPRWSRGVALAAMPEDPNEEKTGEYMPTKREYTDELAPEISFDATTVGLGIFALIAFQFFVVANM